MAYRRFPRRATVCLNPMLLPPREKITASDAYMEVRQQPIDHCLLMNRSSRMLIALDQ